MGNRNSLPATPAGVSATDERAYWRAEADRHAKERNSFYQKSQEAYKARRGAEAKQLSNQGKAADRAMMSANQKAAEAAFRGNNCSRVRDSDTVDLHDLYVEEAVSRLQKRLDDGQKEGLEHLVVIVGQGHHSAGGVQRIRPAAEQLLRERGLAFMPGRPNAGCLWVELPAAAPAPRGLFARVKAFLRRLFPAGGCGMFAAGYGG
ncbi:hypothetical protein WJX81_003648 [Elliptochloris bilobata]|uniref:Smr domain-containing protein n=1 Tax=Elliptochloris bilobata TaxID=381761 RepID=A0AAW1QTN5_9CHLO